MPLWTFWAPLLIAHLGTQVSLHFQFAPGVAYLYLPIPLGMAMVQWWGRRAVVGVYLNAMFSAGLWGLPSWMHWPLYALPETLAVAASGWAFRTAGRGRAWLPEIRDTQAFLLLALLPAACIDGFLVPLQLAALGDMPWDGFWAAVEGEFVGTLLGGLAVAVPLLVFLTHALEKRGWSATRGAVPPELHAEGRARLLSGTEIGALFTLPLLAISLLPASAYWVGCTGLGLWAGLRFGKAMAIAANAWIMALTFLFPLLFGLGGWAGPDGVGLTALQLGLGFTCAVSLITGSTLDALYREIGTRKAAEKKLAFTRHSLDQAGDPVFWCDAGGRIVDASEAAGRTLEESREALLGREIGTIEPGMDESAYRELWASMAAGASARRDTFLQTGRGNRIPVEIACHRVAFQGEEACCCIVRNISERKAAEALLRESDARHAHLLADGEEVIAVADAEGRVKYASPNVATRFGWAPEDLVGRSLRELLENETALAWEAARAALLRGREFGGGEGSLEGRLLGSDGEYRWIALRWADKRSVPSIRGLLLHFKDIGALKRARSDLAESEARFRILVENAPEVIVVLDMHTGRFRDFNENACRFFRLSREQLLETGPVDMSPEFQPDGRASKDAALESLQRAVAGESPRFEWTHLNAAGEEIPCEVNLTRLPSSEGALVRGSLLDIRPRKRLEAELLKSQRLESLGILAGGIAHDFNNFIGGIFGAIEMALSKKQDPESAAYLEKALSTIDKARGLTQQLLTFAKGGEPIKQVGPLFPFVEESSRFALSGSQVSCRVEVPEDLWICEFDRSQIGQVVDNLVINAAQAMPKGGSLTLSAENVTGYASAVQGDSGRGRFVRISFRDEGKGIPKEILDRIFDPFFTTKQKGHGLGLATCHSILKRHGGSIGVESLPGAGTTFHLYLPALDPSRAQAMPTPRSLREKPHRGNGRFLVMDDEPVVLETITAMLASLGYSAAGASQGTEALELFRAWHRDGGVIAGVLLDLTVPGGLGGVETAKAMRALAPDVPVFVSSGYAEDAVLSRPEDFGFTASLRKPFLRAELEALLNRHLGNGAA